MARSASFKVFECSFSRIYEFGNAPSSQMPTSSPLPPALGNSSSCFARAVRLSAPG